MLIARAAAIGMTLLILAMTMAEARAARAADAAVPDRAEVKAAQQQLQSMGLYSGSTRGTMGHSTRKAVADYQTKLGLEATGALDQRTLFALKNPARVSACADAEMSMADCLDAAVALDQFLDQGAANAEPGDTSTASNFSGSATTRDASDAGSGTTAPPAATAGACDDAKLPVERCLQAISQIDGFLKSRGQGNQ